MRMLSLSELRSVKGIPFSREWVRKAVKDGRFPEPALRFGTSKNARVFWTDQQVDQWLLDRMGERAVAA